jgi:hypothetical protein
MSKINLTEYNDCDIFFLSEIPQDPRNQTIYVAQKDDEIGNISVCFYNKKNYKSKYTGFITFSLTSKQIENFPELKHCKPGTITNTKFGAFIKEECARQSLAYEFKSIMEKAKQKFIDTIRGKGAQSRDFKATPAVNSVRRSLNDCHWLDYQDVLEEINKNLKGPFNKQQTENLVQVLSHWLQVLSNPDRDIDLNLLNIFLGKIKTLVSEQEFAKIVVENVNIMRILKSHSEYGKEHQRFANEDGKSLFNQQLNIFKTLPAELLKYFSVEQFQALFMADPEHRENYQSRKIPFLELSDDMRRLVKEKIHNQSGSLLTHFPSNEIVYAYFKRLQFEEKESSKYNTMTMTHRDQCLEFLKKLSTEKKDDAQPDKHLAQLAGQYIELDTCLLKTRVIACAYMRDEGQNSEKFKILNSILSSLNDLYLDLSKGKSIDTSVIYKKIIGFRVQLKNLHGSWTGMTRSKMEKHFDNYYGQLFKRYVPNYMGEPEDNILNSFLNNQVTIKKTSLESKQTMDPVLTKPPASNPDLEGSMRTYSLTRSEDKMASAPPASMYPVLDTPEPQTINLNSEDRIESPQMVEPTAPPPSLYPAITQELDVSQLSTLDSMPPAYNPAYLQEIQTSGSEETVTVPTAKCPPEILQQACDNIILNLIRETQKSPGMDVEARKNEILATVKYQKLHDMLQDSIGEWMAWKEKQSQQLEQKTIASPVLEKHPVSKSEPVIPKPDSKQTPAQEKEISSARKNGCEQSVTELLTLTITDTSKSHKKTKKMDLQKQESLNAIIN